ncbi:MAG: hypothetical protein GY807_02840 [Gammaproteobacteria bacterium]|nr:hypothetical protein [Gammaproteobacteria bacterium]
MTASKPESPLPQLNPQLYQAFNPLCQALPAEDIANLVDRVAGHVQEIRTALQKNEFLDITLAEAIAESLLAVLANYGQYSTEQQALIVGAVEYFIDDKDVEPDTTSVLGLDDDAEVLNYVLHSIGRADLRVEV